ncbi:MAG: hypothetical protein RLP09_08010 [Sandaracinaceae bacterium]
MEILENLGKKRDALLSRGVALAADTRDRGVAALDVVRSGALDWHATLEARRAELDADGSRWQRLSDLQLLVLDRFDRVLLAFGERVRAEIQRLSRLELSADAPPVKAKVAKPAAAKTAAARTATATKATAKTATGTKAPRKAKAGKTDAKSASKKTPTAKKRAAKKPNGKSLLMPIAGYDSLTAKEVLAELDGLTRSQCETVRDHEALNKKRKTVLKALETRLHS